MTGTTSAEPLRTGQALVAERLRERNGPSRTFFDREAARLAAICRRMAERFQRGGRLLALGAGSLASDAQHVAVEFVHPVIAGKRALPALDLSTLDPDAVAAVLRAEDIVMGFAPPAGDPRIEQVLRRAAARGALCLALPGNIGDYTVAAPSTDPFIHQELMEVLYHVLWETVHVFLERQPLDPQAGQPAGRAGFLYPFLGGQPDAAEDRDLGEVAASMRAKAAYVEALRERAAAEQAEAIAAAALAIATRTRAGGTVLCFGNGGSATDATDLARDLVASPKGYAPVPAISLASDAATLTALANDIGVDAIFARQLIAQGRAADVAVAISTSGGSANIIAGLQEARKRGLLTVALLGYDGGEVLRRRLADHVLVVPSDQIPRIQEAHASMYHALLDALDVCREP